ncbi:MAG: hypothetical protein RL235_324 [Chlamydiota bacterium]|jgi:predicted phosphohydrolase
MRIWAIADLHLSFGVPNKGMDVFGPKWDQHADKIAGHWRALIHPDDLVLIAGDISWAMRLPEVAPDLQWIDALPGTKVMIRGNHDYWWGSLKQMAEILPPSIHVIQNTAFHWKDVAVGGSRLWDTPEYAFGSISASEPTMRVPNNDPEQVVQEEMNAKIFNRELDRLKLSLKAMKPDAKVRIAMTHYPPIGLDLGVSRASQILEEHRIDACVFGHIHNLKAGRAPFGEARGVRYYLTACDYLDFKPLIIM